MNVYHWFDFTVIGLDNYVKALFVFDSGFLSALLSTVLWTVVNMAVQLVLAFVLASLLNVKKLRLRKLYKTLLMFPWAMPGYVSILLWKTGMFNTEFGLLNQWMEKLGLEAQRWLATRRLGLHLLHGREPLAGAALHAHDNGRGHAEHRPQLLRERPARRGQLAPAAPWSITIPTHPAHHRPGGHHHGVHDLQAVRRHLPADPADGRARRAQACTPILTYAYENAFITNNYGYSSAISIIIFLLLLAFSARCQLGRGGGEMRGRKLREGIGLAALNVFFVALCFVTLIPILYALSVSLNGQNALLSSDFSFIPEDFTLDNYLAVFTGEDILTLVRQQRHPGGGHGGHLAGGGGAGGLLLLAPALSRAGGWSCAGWCCSTASRPS